MQDNYLRQERNIYPPGFSYLLKQKDSAWGEGSLQHSTFLMSFLAKGMGFPFFQLKLLLKEGFVLINKGMLRDDSLRCSHTAI